MILYEVRRHRLTDGDIIFFFNSFFGSQNTVQASQRLAQWKLEIQKMMLLAPEEVANRLQGEEERKRKELYPPKNPNMQGKHVKKLNRKISAPKMDPHRQIKLWDEEAKKKEERREKEERASREQRAEQKGEQKEAPPDPDVPTTRENVLPAAAVPTAPAADVPTAVATAVSVGGEEESISWASILEEMLPSAPECPLLPVAPSGELFVGEEVEEPVALPVQ